MDVSLPCWAKFLIGLTGFIIGFAAAAIVPGLGVAVVGGIVGAILPSVMLSIETAAANDKLKNRSPIDLHDLRFQWPIPQSTLVLNATGQWIEVRPGEIVIGGALVLPPVSEPDITLSLLEPRKVPRTSSCHGGSGRAVACGLGGQLPRHDDETLPGRAGSAHGAALTGRWSLDGMTVPETGAEVQLTVVPPGAVPALAVHLPTVSTSTQSSGS